MVVGSRKSSRRIDLTLFSNGTDWSWSDEKKQT